MKQNLKVRSPERAIKRENEIITSYLDRLVLKFLRTCQSLGALDFNPPTEEQKMLNFRNGIMPGESREDKVTQEFCTLNYAWKKFTHKKWIYHKLNLDGFEQGVSANIQRIRQRPDPSKVNIQVVKR